MQSLWPQVEPLLSQVTKPARYIGGELGAQVTIHDDRAVSWLLVYPDTYEIGLPNQGLQILYEILNERDDAVAERSYAPWVDMEAAMRAAGVPLFSLENHLAGGRLRRAGLQPVGRAGLHQRPQLIDLAGVAVTAPNARPRTRSWWPAGTAPSTPNPWPTSSTPSSSATAKRWSARSPRGSPRPWKRRPGRRPGRRASAAPGPGRGARRHMCPSLYEAVGYDGARPGPAGGHHRPVPGHARPGREADHRRPGGQWPYPKQQLVPLTEVVHDRLNVEIFRGCTRGCRFCQAGMITRPVRERPADQVRRMVSDGLARTGYDEVALTSLSSADYSGIEQTVTSIIDDPSCSGQVSVSLPSLRVDAFTVGTAAQIQKVRRTGLTFAPEGGTWRMRQVINKLIREEDLYAAVDAAFSQGWRRVKLYFLIGLPTETDEDTLGHRRAGLSVRGYRPPLPQGRHRDRLGGGLRPQGADAVPVVRPEHHRGADPQGHLLKDAARGMRGLTVRWHDPKATAVEGMVSRGDRRMGAVIEQVWRKGGTFQEWSEYFDLDLWTDALAGHGLSLEDIVLPPPHRARGAALGPSLGRSAPRLPVAGLAGRPGQPRASGLPVDPLLRLRSLHRFRDRARGGFGGAPGRREPRHRAGSLNRGASAGTIPGHGAVRRRLGPGSASAAVRVGEGRG